MKTLQTISKTIFFAAVFAFASCNKDDDNPVQEVTGGSDYYVNAKVDGNNYSNSSFFAPMATVAANTLIIQSSTDSGKSIQIQIQNFNGAGTYNVGGDITRGYVNYMTLSPITTYTSVRGSGTVTVEESTDAFVKGTFTAVAPENEESPSSQVTITEGSFRAKR